MYSGSRGRFTKPDPAGLKAGNLKIPQTLNQYTYTNNDPVNYVDPTGLIGILDGASPDWLCRLGLLVFCPLDFPPIDSPPTREESEPAKPKGKRVRLTKAARADYDEQRRQALNMPAECRKYFDSLSRVGITAEKVIKAINDQNPYDASTSTISQAEAGIVPPNHPDADEPVYKALIDDPARAYTAKYANSAVAKLARSTINDVFWDPQKIYPITILHEALHSLTGLDDPGLARTVGAVSDSLIDNALRSKRCSQ
jgi:uncharacterized protein RhaS with RHS repeats